MIENYIIRQPSPWCFGWLSHACCFFDVVEAYASWRTDEAPRLSASICQDQHRLSLYPAVRTLQLQPLDLRDTEYQDERKQGLDFRNVCNIITSESTRVKQLFPLLSVRYISVTASNPSLIWRSRNNFMSQRKNYFANALILSQDLPDEPRPPPRSIMGPWEKRS